MELPRGSHSQPVTPKPLPSGRAGADMRNVSQSNFLAVFFNGRFHELKPSIRISRFEGDQKDLNRKACCADPSGRKVGVSLLSCVRNKSPNFPFHKLASGCTYVPHI